MDGPTPPRISISPPLLNSATPWATTLKDLKALYDCPHTGAVTTRTTLIQGFPHDKTKHQKAFFSTQFPGDRKPEDTPSTEQLASVNNMGYSPLPLTEYLSFIKSIHNGLTEDSKRKTFIVSVTGTPNDISRCYSTLSNFQQQVPLIPLAMEINISCPNIPNAPPAAFTEEGIQSYLQVLPLVPTIPVGLKTPPYTVPQQFEALLGALRNSCLVTTARSMTKRPCRISFITTSNTLGSCLVLDEDMYNMLPGETGLGGMAGPPLHPLALGNVRTIKRMMRKCMDTGHIRVIGTGGVGDKEGYKRMRKVGAAAVGVGTALGRDGIDVFGKIAEGFNEKQ